MQAVAHNPAFAKKAGVPQSVGKEFTKAGGGMAESKAMVKKEVAFMKKKGASKSMIKHEESEMKKMSKGGATKKMAMGGYADGGMPMVMKDGQKVPAFAADGKGKMAKGGMAMKKMASGGMTSMGKVKTAAPSRDGVAVKGKTKGKMVVMSGSSKGLKKGGYC